MKHEFRSHLKQHGRIVQLGARADVGQLVDVPWTATHTFEIIPRTIDVLNSLLLEEVDHLSPEDFREVALTNVRVAIVPKLDVFTVEHAMVDFSRLRHAP